MILRQLPSAQTKKDRQIYELPTTKPVPDLHFLFVSNDWHRFCYYCRRFPRLSLQAEVSVNQNCNLQYIRLTQWLAFILLPCEQWASHKISICHCGQPLNVERHEGRHKQQRSGQQVEKRALLSESGKSNTHLSEPPKPGSVLHASQIVYPLNK